jgi:hypothetical protein
MALFSIHILSSPPLFSFSVFCFPYLPLNIAVKRLSLQLHVQSSNLDGSLSWVKVICGHLLCPRYECCDTDHSTLLIINRLTITYNKKRYMKSGTSNLQVTR